MFISVIILQKSEALESELEKLRKELESEKVGVMSLCSVIIICTAHALWFMNCATIIF